LTSPYRALLPDEKGAQPNPPGGRSAPRPTGLCTPRCTPPTCTCTGPVGRRSLPDWFWMLPGGASLDD